VISKKLNEGETKMNGTTAAANETAKWPDYCYDTILAASERVNWSVEDLIGFDKHLDFNRPFMPESLARVESLQFLTPKERMILNQIRGHDYLYIFGLVEEFILPFVLDHARPILHGDDARVRAYLNFAGEEAKHIDLFKRFRRDFLGSFGVTCEVIGPPEAIAQAILSKHPLAVALVILHIEWMTQRHYLDSVVDDAGLDPQFKSLLKHHWMEESQHVKLDSLMVQAIADTCSDEERAKAIDGYLEIGGMLDAGLMQQVKFDFESLKRATGRAFTPEETDRFFSTQQQATRWTFLGTGMSHKNFLTVADLVKPGAAAQLEQIVPLFS
jgi:hypothetical protein